MCWHTLFLPNIKYQDHYRLVCLDQLHGVRVCEYKIPVIQLICQVVRWPNGGCIWQFILVAFYWLFMLWPLTDIELAHATKTVRCYIVSLHSVKLYVLLHKFLDFCMFVCQWCGLVQPLCMLSKHMYNKIIIINNKSIYRMLLATLLKGTLHSQ